MVSLTAQTWHDLCFSKGRANTAQKERQHMEEITRAKGGTDERTVPVNEIEIPDLWHFAMRNEGRDQEMILEVWYLCHDLLKHIKGE